jgi:hypothetical protein
MSQLKSTLQDIKGQHFSSKTEVAANVLTVAFTGNLDMDALALLKDFYVSLHREAAALKVARVDVQLHELYFINSSCLKVLVTWISQVREGAGAEHYPIRFLTNPNLHWQRRSLNALQCLARDLITIDAGDAP